MTIKMLIDATHEEETRVAIVHGNRVEEFDYESSAKKQIKGNIYLAKITRVEPSLQAAFVEYGGNRHGFLAFSEIHPDYYQIPVSDREALIAEESAAYAKLLAEEEDVVEQKPKRKPRRRAKSSPAKDDKSVGKSKKTEEIAEVEAAPVADTVSESEPDSTSDSATDNDTPSITKAETVAEAETITEKITDVETSGDDIDDNGENNYSEDDDDEDETEIAGSHIIDDEEAEEKLRIKIAKGLRRKYKIQEVIKKNQIILIQVVKEERGNKGAALTTYLSLPGRYCVLMPNTLHGGGVSRKIANMGERKSLKKILADLDMPSGIACIIRTAGQSRTKTEIKRDFDYLIRTWEGIRERTLKSVAPVMINEEGDLIKRSLRDLYTREVDEILVEGEKGYKTARSFMRLLMPSHARKIKHYEEPIPLFHKYQVESQLDSMYSPTVQLKSGGYIVINPTEALVSIDVNSGKATKEHNIEETARKTNLEAAEEVARQLRLRDMAGLIVIDFIDMEVRGNNRAVEQRMKDCLKSDRARIQVGRISSFGLMEMSRQRLRAGVLESSTRACPHCEGAGVIRSVESQVLHILRALEEEGIKGRNEKVAVHLPEQTAIYLLNNKREKLVSLENQYNFTIEVIFDGSLTESAYKLDMANSDSKKSEKQGAGGQSKKRESNQQEGRTHNKPHGERPEKARRNRQRDQSRKNKKRNENNRDDHPKKSQEEYPYEENSQETVETHSETPSSENQDNKPRRRRRRPRRNNQDQAGSAHREENNTGADDVQQASAPTGTADGAIAERPKNPRRSRGGKNTSSNNTGTETSNKVPENKASDNKAGEKPARRPYPPQARSRRNSEDSKKSSTSKTGSNIGPKSENSEPAGTLAKPPVKNKTKTAVTKEASKSTEPQDTGPKKSGWWQRTFG